MGVLLYLVTKKTGSVWTAAIMHAVNNSGGKALGLCLDTEVLTGIWAEKPLMLFLSDMVVHVMGVIAIVMLVKMKKEEA